MDIQLLAERFIDSVPKSGIQEQLRWFKIDRIEFVAFIGFGKAYLDIAEFHGEYKKLRGMERLVRILLPVKTTLEDKLVSVGHELGHTFGLFPENASLRDHLPWIPRNGGKWGRAHGLNSKEEVETFCDVFGELWLQERTNKKNLCRLLMSTLGVGTIRI